jgi:nucleoid DNA-binding protein
MRERGDFNMIKKDKKIELLTKGMEFKSKAEQGRKADEIEKEFADKLQDIYDGLEVGENVKFAGLEISFVHVDAREGRNPRTKETIQIPAKDVIKVKLDK